MASSMLIASASVAAVTAQNCETSSDLDMSTDRLLRKADEHKLRS